MRVVGIVAPFAPMGAGTRGTFVLSTRGGNGPRRRVSGAPSSGTLGYATGEPGKLQSRDRVGIVEGSCGYRARGVSIRGKFHLAEFSYFMFRV